MKIQRYAVMLVAGAALMACDDLGYEGDTGDVIEDSMVDDAVMDDTWAMEPSIHESPTLKTRSQRRSNTHKPASVSKRTLQKRSHVRERRGSVVASAPQHATCAYRPLCRADAQLSELAQRMENQFSLLEIYALVHELTHASTDESVEKLGVSELEPGRNLIEEKNTPPMKPMKAPRFLKVPKTCWVLKPHEGDEEDIVRLACSGPLPKRIRGWELLDETSFDDVEEREWQLRTNGHWRLMEMRSCAGAKCSVSETVIIKILGC